MSSGSILSEDHIDEITELVRAGRTDQQIADRFGCSRPTIVAFRSKHEIHRKRIGEDKSSKRPTYKPDYIYYDPSVKHTVKHYPPMQAGGDLPPDEEEFLAWP